jgi:adenylate cyclase, class 2
MAIEIEKKFRLTEDQRELVLKRLEKIGARFRREEFEENTLYDGNALVKEESILRLRRIGKTAILTFKQRLPATTAIKRRREDETRVDDPEAMDAILDALGFTRTLVYEKRRQTWSLGNAEITIDELPFGYFMEIEGSEDEIRETEQRLDIKGLRGVHTTYPQLSRKYGKQFGNVIEARFEE